MLDLSYTWMDMFMFTDCQSQLAFDHFISASVSQTTLSLNPDADVPLDQDQSEETRQINPKNTTDHVLYSLLEALRNFISTA